MPRSPKQNRFRFGLRWLFGLVFVLSLGMSWFAWKLRQANAQGEATDAIMAIPGCVVFYDRQGWMKHGSGYYNCDIDGCPWYLVGLEPERGIRDLFGEHFGRRVVTVELSLGHFSDAIPHVKRLPYLKKIKVLSPDTQHDEQLDSAVEVIRRSFPGVEVWGVELDLSFDLAPPDESSSRVPRHPDDPDTVHLLATCQRSDSINLYAAIQHRQAIPLWRQATVVQKSVVFCSIQ